MDEPKFIQALMETLDTHDPKNHYHNYYDTEPGHPAGGWIDCQIDSIAEALEQAGWTPPSST